MVKAQVPAPMVAMAIHILTIHLAIILTFTAYNDGVLRKPPPPPLSNPDKKQKYNQLLSMKQELQSAVLQSQERNRMFQQFHEEQTHALLLIQKSREQIYELLNSNNKIYTTTAESLEPHHSTPEVESVIASFENDNEAHQ